MTAGGILNFDDAVWRLRRQQTGLAIGKDCLGLFDTCPCDATVRRMGQT